MLYQIIITTGLAVFLLNLLLNLKAIKTPRADSKIPKSKPLISVLVPARDEENNIRNCLESLQKQDYPNYEILVLNDNSVDSTAEIVSEMAAKDNRIQLIEGQPLPEGWAGKPFACYQLAQQAKGSWLLFVDADTTHAEHMLRSVLSLAMKLKISLLSGFPRQMANSLPQKITVPLIYFIIIGWAPLWWIQRAKSRQPSVAIGQFLMFRRDEYWRIGGHYTVRNRILEDIWMGIEVARYGGKHVAIDLSSVVSCHMYPTPGAMWHGLVRCIYSVTAISPLMLLVLIAVACCLYIAPFYCLWNGLFVIKAPFVWLTLVVTQVLMIFFMRFLVDTRFKESAISTWLHPIGITYLLLAVLYSIWRWAVGAGVSWKERAYGKEESIVK
jgi:chlorobactene glucosyltransferase